MSLKDSQVKVLSRTLLVVVVDRGIPLVPLVFTREL
jgi:hypothetical protein